MHEQSAIFSPAKIGGDVKQRRPLLSQLLLLLEKSAGDAAAGLAEPEVVQAAGLPHPAADGAVLTRRVHLAVSPIV